MRAALLRSPRVFAAIWGTVLVAAALATSPRPRPQPAAAVRPAMEGDATVAIVAICAALPDLESYFAWIHSALPRPICGACPGSYALWRYAEPEPPICVREARSPIPFGRGAGGEG
jgi:hypothetical protein